MISEKTIATPSFEGIHEYVQNMYFENPNSCVPAKYLGTIDSSYEGATNYIMNLFEQKIVLLQGSWNAGSFWFKDEVDFEDWMDDCLEEMEGGLQNKKE